MKAVTVLGFDYGRRRLGVAVGQSVSGTATPLKVLPVRRGAPEWPLVAALVADWEPTDFVLGWPTTADGRPTGLEDELTAFAAELSRRFGLPVHTIDERLSSYEAGTRQERPGAALDALAAQVIVETWLRDVNQRGGGLRA